MKLIKSPCSSRTRITFLDKIGTPDVVVVFSKRSNQGAWAVHIADKVAKTSHHSVVTLSNKPTVEDAEQIYLKAV